MENNHATRPRLLEPHPAGRHLDLPAAALLGARAGVALERAWALRGVLARPARLTARGRAGCWRTATCAGRARRRAKHRACRPPHLRRRARDERRPPMPPSSSASPTERQFEEVQGAGSNLWMLGTIGAAAPFIGLFGTVIGIIRAFHAMAIAGTGGFAVVAAGISEALIATALGLAVGIVAVVFYNYFQARVERIDAALRIGSARVLEALVAGRRVAMAFSNGAGRKRGIMAEINVTPLTDVFLVLLIIFMITTSAMMKPEDVHLPETAEEQQETQGVMVTMTPSHEIYVNDRPRRGRRRLAGDRAPRRARQDQGQGGDSRRRPAGRPGRGSARARARQGGRSEGLRAGVGVSRRVAGALAALVLTGLAHASPPAPQTCRRSSSGRARSTDCSRRGSVSRLRRSGRSSSATWWRRASRSARTATGCKPTWKAVRTRKGRARDGTHVSGSSKSSSSSSTITWPGCAIRRPIWSTTPARRARCSTTRSRAFRSSSR